MNMFIRGAAAFALFVGISTSVKAADWNDGVLFVDAKVGSEEGRDVFAIMFGLAPGKCTEEITAVKEDLRMEYGTANFNYGANNKVDRSAGETWSHDDGTKVKLCNDGDGNFLVTGRQYRPVPATQ